MEPGDDALAENQYHFPKCSFVARQTAQTKSQDETRLPHETKPRHEPKLSDETKSTHETHPYNRTEPRDRSHLLGGTNDTKPHDARTAAIVAVFLALDYAAEHIRIAIDACRGTAKNARIEIGDVLQKLWPYYYGILYMPIVTDVPTPLPPLPLQLDLTFQRDDNKRAEMAKRVVPHNAHSDTVSKQVPPPDGDDDTMLDVGPGMTQYGTQGLQDCKIDTKLLNDYQSLLQKVICNNCGKTKANTLFIPCRHLVTCHDCAETMKACKLCGKEIMGMVKVFTG
jgi:hypothetical protein